MQYGRDFIEYWLLKTSLENGERLSIVVLIWSHLHQLVNDIYMYIYWIVVIILFCC